MDGWIKIGTKIDTKSFDKQIEDLEQELETLEQRYKEYETMKPFKGQEEDMKGLAIQIEKTKNKLVGLQQQQLKLSKGSTSALKGIGNGVDGVIKKIGKWAIAIFGVRSAYMLIRRSMSTLTQYDDNLASQLDYISWTIANAIAPIVNWILNMVHLILQYVNQIIESLFGFRLFKGPQEFAKSMKSASGSAKEIQKALAGFDEKNILSTGASSGGGGSNFTMPQFKDVSDAPKWMQWLFKNGKVLRLILEGIATAILTIKNNLTLLQGVGLFLVIDGIANTIRDIKNYLDEPTWENFNDVLLDISETLAGIFLLFKGSTLGTIAGTLGIIVMAVWALSDALQNTKKYLDSPSWDNFKSMLNKLSIAFGPLGAIVSLIIGLFRDFKGQVENARKEIEKLNTTMNNLPKGVDLVVGNVSSTGQKLGSWLKGKLGFASGGIINNPGRGVPLTSAVGGEQGAEGIVPLSNAQAMEQLGETIGRYITINLTNTTELDGSIIARRVSKINQENNFARNR